MRKILFRYSCIFFFFIGSFVMLANDTPTLPPPNGHPGGVPPPEGADCCDYLYEGDDPDGSPEYQACLDNPAAHCPVPVDNSIYIYISMVAGVALASFVIARRIKT